MDETTTRTGAASVGVALLKVTASLTGGFGVVVLALGVLMYAGGSDAGTEMFATIGTGLGVWAMQWGAGFLVAAATALGLLRLVERR